MRAPSCYEFEINCSGSTWGQLLFLFFFFLMKGRPPRSTLERSSAASDVYKRQPPAACLLQGNHAKKGFSQSRKSRKAYVHLELKTTLGGVRYALRLLRLREKKGVRFGFSSIVAAGGGCIFTCLLYTSPSPRDRTRSRMPSSA